MCIGILGDAWIPKASFPATATTPTIRYNISYLEGCKVPVWKALSGGNILYFLGDNGGIRHLPSLSVPSPNRKSGDPSIKVNAALASLSTFKNVYSLGISHSY